MIAPRVHIPWPGYTALDARYVNVSGDTMTGQLINSVSVLTPELIGSALASGTLILTSTSHATKGNIQLGQSLIIAPDGSAPGNSSFGVLLFPNGGRLYEQSGSGDPDRVFWLGTGDRLEFLTESGGTFIAGFHGPNSATADRIVLYKGLCSASYAAIAPPTNGAIFAGNVGIGINAPVDRFHVVGSSNTFFYIDGNASYGSTVFRTSGTTVRGYIGYSATSGYITNSISNAMHIRGESGVCIGTAATQGIAVGTSGRVFIGTEASTTSAARLFIKEPTLGNEVLRVESLATNDDVRRSTYQQRLATTNATVTTIATIAVPATTTIGVVAHVVARRTGGTAGTAEDGAFYRVDYTAKNVAGTATIIGAAITTVIGEDQAGWDVTVDMSGANSRIRVTGAADNNITWHITYEYYPISS